jgi:hypothetical protein
MEFVLIPQHRLVHVIGYWESNSSARQSDYQGRGGRKKGPCEVATSPPCRATGNFGRTGVLASVCMMVLLWNHRTAVDRTRLVFNMGYWSLKGRPDYSRHKLSHCLLVGDDTNHAVPLGMKCLRHLAAPEWTTSTCDGLSKNFSKGRTNQH